MDNITENVIIEASEGNTDAFESIYKAHSDFVYNVAYRTVNNIDEAQEVTQEVFLVIYCKLKSFKFKSSLRTWIYRIAVNMAIDYARKKSREQEHTILCEDINKLTKAVDFVDEKIEREQKEKNISTLLEALSPNQRVCIILRSIEGLRYQEIAKSLNININTVRSRLKRAREKLIALRKEMVKNEM